MIHNFISCIYNVITIKASIITIGNSKGVHIPKVLLEESGLTDEVNIKVSKKGEIKIIAIKSKVKASETAILSEEVFVRDWLRPEEDEAWASLK